MHITRLIRSEGRKLATTRWFPITVAGTLLLCPLGAFVNVESGGKNGAPPLGSVSSIHHVLAVGALTSMVMIGVGIAIMAGEYRHSTSVPTFLVTPRRREVVIAKLVTATAVGAVLGALAFGAALATAIPALGWHGVHHLAGDTAQMWLGAALATGLFGALGVAVGALTRSTVIAIVGTIVWVQFVEEALLASALPAVGKWLPTGANIAITRTATHPARLLAPGLATVVLLAWAAVITGTAGRFVVRRDV